MMKRANADVINGWQAGKTYPGVIFVQAEAADVVTGPDAGTTVDVITLEALEPEPHYLVERADGTSFIAKQSGLRKPKGDGAAEQQGGGYSPSAVRPSKPIP